MEDKIELAIILEKYPFGIRLRDDINLCFPFENEIKFVHNDKEMNINQLSQENIFFVKDLIKGISIKSIIIENLTERQKHLLSVFERFNCLRTSIKKIPQKKSQIKQLDWISNFVNDLDFYKEVLEHTKIMIVGCGGTGSIVADHFARAGFSSFLLIDNARVDIPDLNRQWPYSLSDVDTLKVTALSNHLHELSKHIKTKLDDSQIESETQILNIIKKHSPDFVFCCADTPRYLINSWMSSACAKTRTPVIFGGVGIDRMSIGPLMDNPHVMNRYSEILKTESKKTSDKSIIQGSICFSNSITAASIAFQSFQYLMKIKSPNSYNKILIKDVLTGNLIKSLDLTDFIK